MTKAEALARHSAIAAELGDLYVELGQVRGAERETKVNAFRSNPVATKEREHIANFQALPDTKEVWKLEAEIAALVEERDDIRWQLTHGAYL